MKILHVIDHMGLGGAQTIIKGIFEKETNNENIFCYSLRNNKIRVEVNHHNVYSHAGFSKFNIISLFELRTLVKDHNIDILHCHLPKSMFFGYLLKLLFFKNIILIFHEHGSIFQNRWWYRQFIKRTQDKVDLYIAISKATQKQLIENAGIKEDEIKILLNFVDLEYFRPQTTNRLEERRKLGLDDNDFILGFAGRHIERKGCHDLILALGKLKHLENIKLLITGDGPKKKENIKYANKLGLERNIFFLGYIPDIRWLYSIIDCFVIPSHWEPFGLVALEAHATGVPVISSNVEGLNEVVFDAKTGFLFEPKDQEDLAKKIELLYHNEDLRRKIIENGLKSAGNYSLEKYLMILESIYCGLKE
ncbi:MAG: glycosyltransferase family 4 protein [Candidatus Methanoperedens sp.]|nr:glycosyltransferase family 4 protein [Candidatus Methanoperedens sp.]